MRRDQRAAGGASVLVLEGAPKFYRGGNTRHTRNMRCAHDAATDILTGPYTEQEFWEDLQRVTGGETDEELARFMISESKDILNWIVEQGVRWQPSLGGTLSSAGPIRSFSVAAGMLNALYLTASGSASTFSMTPKCSTLSSRMACFSPRAEATDQWQRRRPRLGAGRRRRRL